jgi:hypothetical protein
MCHRLYENIKTCNLNSGFPHIGAERQITRRNILVENFWINHVEIQVFVTTGWVQQALAWLITNLCLNIPFCGNVRSLIHNRLHTQPISYLYQYSSITRTTKTFDLSVVFTVRFQLLHWDVTGRLCMWSICESVRRTSCTYRGTDKSLARPTSRCILFDGENISFDASLVIYTVLIFLQLWL